MASACLQKLIIFRCQKAVVYLRLTKTRVDYISHYSTRYFHGESTRWFLTVYEIRIIWRPTLFATLVSTIGGTLLDYFGREKLSHFINAHTLKINLSWSCHLGVEEAFSTAANGGHIAHPFDINRHA